jgi:hypothetical protein
MIPHATGAKPRCGGKLLPWGERRSMTDRRDKEREREDDKRRREDEERERRAGELREAWRRRHPTEEERDKDSWPKKGSPA